MSLDKRLGKLEKSSPALYPLELKGEYPPGPMETWSRADLERFVAECDSLDPVGGAKLRAMSQDELRAIAEGQA